MSKSVVKDPQSVLSYGWDWADGSANDGSATDTGWLQGDTISTSVWTITGQDATLIKDSDTNSTTETTIILSGGTAGKSYAVVNHITTTGGLSDDRTITVKVANK